MKRKSTGMHVKYAQSAGIDIAKNEHWVVAPKVESGELEVKKYGGFTEDLESMSKWLAVREIQYVAMEATGVYWIPAYEYLERSGFEV